MNEPTSLNENITIIGLTLFNFFKKEIVNDIQNAIASKQVADIADLIGTVLVVADNDK